MNNTHEKKVLDKLSEIIEKGTREDFNKAYFPTKESLEDFKIFVEKLVANMELSKKDPYSLEKFEIMKKFLEKMIDENLYDPPDIELYDDRYTLTKKIDQGLSAFNGFAEKWDSSKETIPIDDLCKAYAYSYERFCKRFVKPLAKRIKGKSIRYCSTAMAAIEAYEPDTKKVFENLIPQIRNGIDHTDYFFDYQKNVIRFEDEDKKPVELTYTDLKNLIHKIVEDKRLMAAQTFVDALKEGVDSKVVTREEGH